MSVRLAVRRRRAPPPSLPHRVGLHTSSPASAVDASTVLRTLSSYCNDPSRALDFYHWVSRRHQFTHTAATSNLLLDILGKHLHFPLLLQTLLSAPHPPDHSTFRILFNRLSAAHLVSDALSAFSSHPASPRDERTYHLLVDALCEHLHVEEAERLCLSADAPFPPSTKVYNMLLRGWAKTRSWRRCRQFWERFDQDGIPRDLHSYSIFMDVQSKSGKPLRALQLHRDMKKKGITMDVVAYNILLGAVGMVRGVDFSVALLKEMWELGCRPNAASYNTIFKMLCADGRLVEARTLLDQMRKSGCEPDVMTYHCFFRCLSDAKEILALFDQMLEGGCRPRMDTYVMLMNKFGRWGFLRPVFMVWRVMEEQGCSPDAFAYNALIDALLHKGLIGLARKYDREMLAKGLSARPRRELAVLGGGGAAEPPAESEICNLFV